MISRFWVVVVCEREEGGRKVWSFTQKSVGVLEVNVGTFRLGRAWSGVQLGNGKRWDFLM